MDITLKIGTRSETVQVPEANLQGILTPNEVPVALTGEAEVRRALNEPIGTPRLRDIVHPGEKIAIITSDITRPMPTWKVMPALLDELKEAGVWVFGTAADGDRLLYDADLKGPAAIVIGSEGTGMSRLVAEKCDFKVRIPMKGRLNSLNASAAAAIMLYEAVRQRMQL